MLLRVFIPAMCGLALLISGCGLFKNAVRNTQTASHIDRSVRNTSDSQSYEHIRVVDTIVDMQSDSSSLLTNLAQLRLQPTMLSVANGIRIRIAYDTMTGSIRTDAVTEQRRVPVRMHDFTREISRSKADTKADVSDHVDAKQVTRTTNANWNLIIITVAGIVTLGIILYLFIIKKTSLL